MQDIAQRQHALEYVVGVDHHKSMHAGATNRVKDRVETVLGGAGVNPREVLLRCQPREMERGEGEE